MKKTLLTTVLSILLITSFQIHASVNQNSKKQEPT